MDSAKNADVPSQLNYKGYYNTIIALEITLVLGIIWLVFKKHNARPLLKLTSEEEEEIIKGYTPESLVSVVSKEHPALRGRTVLGKVGMHINLDGIQCLNFSSHDYLGLIGDSRIEHKVMKCIDTYGVGSCGPRAFYGTSVEHLKLEKLLADIFEAEDTLVYSNGFATVASAIPVYTKKADIIFVDEKRNFAIQRGLDASKSKVRFFKHNDVEDLEIILEEVWSRDILDKRKARNSRRYLIVEGIYFNTGRICPLPQLVKLCKKYKIRIFIDESISFGVLGETGKGVTEYFGVSRVDIDLIMGTFENALASIGGFCTGSRLLIDHQQLAGQGYCFSASLPPLHVTATMEALHLIQEEPERLARLMELCRVFHFKLNSSKVINNHFTVNGDPASPLHLLTLRREVLQVHEEPEQVLQNIIDSCIYKNVAVTRASYVADVDSVMFPASLRITTSIFQDLEQISYFIRILEEVCRNVFFNCYNNPKIQTEG